MLAPGPISFSLHVAPVYLLAYSLAVMTYEQHTVLVRRDSTRVD